MLMSWPPGTSPVRTSVFLPRRAAVTPAVRPAIPPPAITTSNSVANVVTPNRRRQRHEARAIEPPRSRIRSTPGIDRDGRDVIGAEYFPRALSFAADYDDVDIARLIHLHDLVGRRLEFCRIRLDAGGGARPHQRLHPLIVPIVARRQAGVLGTPIDQILFRIDAAGLEQPRHERIEHHERRQIGCRGEAAPEFCLPGVARAKSFLHIAQADEHAHGAFGRLESFLHMERLPRAALLVLGKGEAIGKRIAERAHIGFARHRSALPVLRQQAVSPADRRIGVAVGAERTDAAIHADLVADRAVDHAEAGHRGGAALPRRGVRRGKREDDGKILRPRAGHHRVDRDFFDRVLPGLAKIAGAHAADHFVRRLAGRLEHSRDALLGRQDDGQKIGPAIVEKQLAKILFAVRRNQPRRRALERRAGEIGVIERAGQAVDHLLHERPAGNLVAAFDIGAQLRRGAADDRLRHKSLPQCRNAAQPRGRLGDAGEHMGVDRDARHAVAFQQRCQPDDRRATGASKPDTQNGGIAVGRDLLAHIQIVDPALARRDDLGVDGRQMFGEPLPQLLHERRGIVEQAIDQVDDLAVKAGKAWRQTLAGDFRRIATRIVNAQEFGHAFLILLSGDQAARPNLDQASSPFKIGADVRAAHGGLAATALDLILAANCTREGPKEHRMNRIVAPAQGQPIEAPAPAAKTFTVLSPVGTPPKITRKTAAPRLESLDGKTIYLVDCRFDDSIELLKQVAAWFAAHMPGVTTKIVSLSATYQKDDPKTWEEIKANGDAAIIGVGHCSNCAPAVTTHAITLETKYGVPTVALHTDKFDKVVASVAKMAGLPEAPRSFVPQPVMGKTAQELAAYVNSNNPLTGRPVMQEVVQALTSALDGAHAGH